LFDYHCPWSHCPGIEISTNSTLRLVSSQVRRLRLMQVVVLPYTLFWWAIAKNLGHYDFLSVISQELPAQLSAVSAALATGYAKLFCAVSLTGVDRNAANSFTAG